MSGQEKHEGLENKQREKQPCPSTGIERQPDRLIQRRRPGSNHQGGEDTAPRRQ